MTVKNKSPKVKNLLLKIADLEWRTFYPKPTFTYEELKVLLDSNYQIEFLEDKNCVFAYCLYQIDDDSIYIDNIAVSPEYQKLGYGTKLINQLKDQLKENHLGIYSNLTDDYLEIGSFLKKNGFTYTSTTHSEEFPEDNIYFFFYENPNYNGKIETREGNNGR